MLDLMSSDADSDGFPDFAVLRKPSLSEKQTLQSGDAATFTTAAPSRENTASDDGVQGEPHVHRLHTDLSPQTQMCTRPLT